MPSARIHEAVAKEINKDYNMDEILLRIGTVSPDSWRNVKDSSGFKDKNVTHFWDFKIKEGQANNYDEFYLKYFNQLSNPFYFGYLIHLITDQYWKTYIDPKYEVTENGVEGFRLKDGSFHDNANWFGYFEDIKLQKMLARKYNLGYLPTEEKDIPNFYCSINEIDLSGLFGKNGTLSYINKELTYENELQESLIFDLDEIIKSIDEVVKYIKKELKRLEIKKATLDMKYKIAIDIDDTLLDTKELKDFYWNIFLQENSHINLRKELKIEEFWDKYREKIAFGKVKIGASKCLDNLIEKDCVIDLLSARPLEKYNCLKKQIVKYFEDNNLHYNYMYLGFASKIDFLKEHNYNLLIDNDLEHIEQANKVGINTILFAESINFDYSGNQASNWKEVNILVEKLLENRKQEK